MRYYFIQHATKLSEQLQRKHNFQVQAKTTNLIKEDTPGENILIRIFPGFDRLEIKIYTTPSHRKKDATGRRIFATRSYKERQMQKLFDNVGEYIRQMEQKKIYA